MRKRKTDFFEIADLLNEGWEIRQSLSTGAVWLTHPKKLFRPNMSIDVFERMLEEANIEKRWSDDSVAAYRLSEKGHAVIDHALLTHDKEFYGTQKSREVYPHE